jgi:hypothetical protein
MNLAGLVPTDEMRGDSEQDTRLLREILEEAGAFLRGFDWCLSVDDSYFGFGVGGVVAVFLLRIVPAHEGVDELLWVVTGDLPPAYIVTEGNPTAIDALAAYVDEMSMWVRAARRGDSLDDLIPVNVPPTPENAENLERRLEFLRAKIMVGGSPTG